MTKIVKIETGDSGVDHKYGTEVVRFTYDDGVKVYASVGAFPSREVMVTDCSNPNSAIQPILAFARGKMTDEAGDAHLVSAWTTEWAVTLN